MLKLKPRSRGSILVLALFFMILLSLLAGAVMRLMPAEARAAGVQSRELNAFYTADAGVQESIEHIRRVVNVGGAPEDNSKYPPPTATLPSGWSYSTKIEQTAFGVAGIRSYKITSDALLDGRRVRQVIAYVAEDSWLKYQLATDANTKLTENINWEGPLYVDGILTIENKNKDEPDDPIFDSTVQITEWAKKSADGIDWKNKKGAPTTDAEYATWFEDGRSALVAGAQSISPPGATQDVNRDKVEDIIDRLAIMAWGADNPTPVPDAKSKTVPKGVYIPNTTGVPYPEASAGLFIQGDVHSMELGSVQGNKAIRMRIPLKDDDFDDESDGEDFAFDDSDPDAISADTGKDYYMVTYVSTSMKLPNGTTLSAATSSKGGYTVLTKPDGSFSVYDGLTNGVVYASKKIKQLAGEHSGITTIAAGKEIRVTERVDGKPEGKDVHKTLEQDTRIMNGISIKGVTPPNANNPLKDNLGLVSRKLKLKFKDDDEGKKEKQEFALYANLIATDKIKGNIKKDDTLDLYGSMIYWNDKEKKKLNKLFNKKSEINFKYLGKKNYLPGIPGMGNFYIVAYVENRLGQ